MRPYRKFTIQKTHNKNMEDFNVVFNGTSEELGLKDFCLLQRTIKISQMHRVKVHFCELLNLGNKQIMNIPEKEKEYEQVLENELTILIYLN